MKIQWISEGLAENCCILQTHLKISRLRIRLPEIATSLQTESLRPSCRAQTRFTELQKELHRITSEYKLFRNLCRITSEWFGSASFDTCKVMNWNERDESDELHPQNSHHESSVLVDLHGVPMGLHRWPRSLRRLGQIGGTLQPPATRHSLPLATKFSHQTQN